MKKYIILIMAFASLTACKSKAVLAEGSADSEMAARNIIAGHYANSTDFSTVYIKSTARYKDDKQSQSVTAEIRIKKDQMILVSIRFLGITMAKALITPTEVKYYEKINSNYFEGDYSTLSRWLGADLDFQKVQNMLIGKAIDDLTKEKYSASIEDKLYKLDAESRDRTKKSFYFEGDKFLVKRQIINQEFRNRELAVTYPAYSEFSGKIFPSQLLIIAMQQKGKTTIEVKYDTVSFNEDLSFPYSVPDGYERIFID